MKLLIVEVITPSFTYMIDSLIPMNQVDNMVMEDLKILGIDPGLCHWIITDVGEI